jgi:thiamine biosynthesis lipoprotein
VITVRALGTTCVLAARDERALAQARGSFLRGLRAFDLACSRFRSDSELASVNRAGGRPVDVGPILRDALRVAIRAAAQTDGLVDPTVGRALRLAGYDAPFVRVRLRTTFAPQHEPAGRWREVELDDEHGTVRVPDGVELDLGATAKALAADVIAAEAAAVTGTGIIVALGGDIAVAGAPLGGGWPIRIADDHAAPLDAPGDVVAVTSGGLATSGTSVRRWTTAAGELHHLIHPRTGRPAVTPWRTATVAAASCVDANTASTAAILLAEAAPWWLEARRLPARLVRENGGVVRVAGWPAQLADAA